MNIHLVCTGTELLIGHTLNTNQHFIGGCLDAAGYRLAAERCVSDTGTAIAAAVRDELAHADVVITIGGLGPTTDDLTRDSVARELGVPLKYHPDVHAVITAYLAGRNVTVPAESLRVQAMVPENATPLPNRNGTAPGLWCPAPGGKVVVMLPGPPRELQPMFQEQVLPRLRELAPPEVARVAFSVCGLPESAVAEVVERELAPFADIEPAYCARPAQVEVRLSATPALKARLELARARLMECLGDAVLPAGCSEPAQAVGAMLLERRLWVATAESCTGGWIAKTLTDLPGASAWFSGGLVTYSNDWKECLLDIPEAILNDYGAVSAETVTAMLEALFRRYEADAGIAVTGIAGPAGGTADKPVGLVYIATGLRAQRQVTRHLFPGNRDSVRQRTVTTALNQLRLQLLQTC